MKVIKIAKGFILLFYHLLAPITFWGMIGMMIWGPDIFNKPMEGHPSMIYFMILVPPSMILSGWHYVFNDFVPNALVLTKTRKKTDPQSIEMARQWVQKSKSIAKTKLEALEEYETKLSLR